LLFHTVVRYAACPGAGAGRFFCCILRRRAAGCFLLHPVPARGGLLFAASCAGARRAAS